MGRSLYRIVLDRRGRLFSVDGMGICGTPHKQEGSLDVFWAFHHSTRFLPDGFHVRF
jgi:hypothetical protein